MCGICGFTGQNVDRGQVLTDMMNRIIHRGPDGAGQYMDDEIVMGFRRLSIIDLEGGDQPMRTEDGRLVITFNGEIYNYRELREELKGRGHSFRTRSDTEVLLHGYSEYGVKILDRLRGMFAFVIWDTRKKELFGARDMFGIKPFYYAQAGGSFIYGSEIKSILEYPGYEREVNLEALEQYMSFQYSVLPETFFKGIFRLPAGHYMIWKDGKLRTRRYFDPMLTPVKAKDREKEEGRKTVGEKAVGEKAAGEKAAGEKADSHNCIDGSGAGQSAHDRLVDEIDRAVQESVRYHMVSDVEVASLLSSGVDSSYVAATFKGAKTFTVGFDYETYNEIPYAEALSGEVGIRNYSKIISTREYWKEFPKIQYYMDEPLADASAAALYFVDREASRHVKVILSGEGADELFGGYVIYHEPFSLNAYQKIPAGVRRAAAAAVSVLPGHPKGKGFIMRGAKPVEERFIGNANVYTVKLRNRVLRHTTKNSDPKNLTAPYYRRARHLSDTEKMQYIDLNFWLQGDILLKLGFPVPIRIWLRQDKYYGIVKKAFLSKEAQLFFHTEELMKLLDAHRAGREDYSRQIWTVYTFLVWYRQYFVPGACSVTIEDELAMEHMHEEKNREALEESGAAAPALAR